MSMEPVPCVKHRTSMRIAALLLFVTLSGAAAGCAEAGSESVRSGDVPAEPAGLPVALDLGAAQPPATATFYGTLIAGEQGVFCADGAESVVPVCDRFRIELPADVAAAVIDDVRATRPELVHDSGNGDGTARKWARDVIVELSDFSVERGERGVVVTAAAASLTTAPPDPTDSVVGGRGTFVPSGVEDSATATRLLSVENEIARHLGPVYVSTTTNAGEVEVRTVFALDDETRQAVADQFGGQVRFVPWGTTSTR